MDLRHGFWPTWRRCSPVPRSVLTCTPAYAVTPVQRRLARLQRGVKQGLLACCAVALDNISRPAVAIEPVFLEDVSGQGFCIPEAACPAVLQTRLSKAHTSAASAALVVQDMPDEKLVATASLDKGMAIWRFYSTQGESENLDGSCEESIEVTRLKVPGAPVFSLAKIPEVLPDGTILRKRPKPPGIYLGTASKEVLTWMLGSKDVTDKVVLDGHTGWVRSLAITGKWLFSCGCNYLRLWDTTFRTPKECDAVRLFTGDILAIAASDGRVFTAGADGSLRSWIITRSGDLQEGPSRERAHDGRVSACTVANGRVFTVSYDGSVKAWSAEALELVAEVRGAHNGDKIFCVAVGSNGVVFTGGDDKLVRAWDRDLNPVGNPLEGHAASVRVLSAGRRALLVSGDAEGDVCIWETYPVELPSPSRPSSPSTPTEALPSPLPPSSSVVTAESNTFLEVCAAGGAADAVLAGAGGPPAPPSCAVEVAMAGATMQHLESMLAAQHDQQQQADTTEELQQQQPLVHEEEQVVHDGMVASVSDEQKPPGAGAPAAAHDEGQQQPGAPMPVEEDVPTIAVAADNDDRVTVVDADTHPDSNKENSATAELSANWLAGTAGSCNGYQRDSEGDLEAVASAAPVCYANGSIGFTVMTAAVSGSANAAEEDLGGADASEEEEEAVPSHARQIEGGISRQRRLHGGAPKKAPKLVGWAPTQGASGHNEYELRLV
ncbi:hypothetical protein VOLCADRAFT_98872 [Volvox carteri f. nagariensis]|uniref:Uncharacterized protein n=1 Tax=Volvox carteri f. nagariensis TaxID=3068 RepID=D8UGI1_VOLCA|nr:uncharacterized protein VOLCADRAFT_98872 [Volvox carteri f. nagariensis]EFJ41205.1 hypothetical protein VOLCADRAFT_98872 [Volvox carteri f. nagariensis]|eukprot:XP_002957773.1 hypothetical protein VOLCADRAFT_98872 [Volvox carteri f. nagariensis]